MGVDCPETAVNAESIEAWAVFATDPETPENTFLMWQGPLNDQDGTVVAEAGELVDGLTVWELPQLLATIFAEPEVGRTQIFLNETNVAAYFIHEDDPDFIFTPDDMPYTNR